MVIYLSFHTSSFAFPFVKYFYQFSMRVRLSYCTGSSLTLDFTGLKSPVFGKKIVCFVNVETDPRLPMVTRKHQKMSPWCNSRLRFMEYFLNPLEVSLYFSKEKQ